MGSPDIQLEVFTGENLFERETNVERLIEGYLWERDVVMLLGSEKAGKSILGLQMAANLSTGTKFLDKYPCKQCAVLYLQVEGKKDETPIRLENINLAIPLDKTRFYRVYKKFLPLDILEFKVALEKTIEGLLVKPEVLIIDCLYMSMSGDLNENQDTRRWIGATSEIFEKYKLTVVLIHHAKREIFFEGAKVEIGDKSSYGSVFWRANVDHIIYLDMKRDKTRTLSCETQRSGKVADTESLILIQPTPLFFKTQSALTASEETILWHLRKRPMTKIEIAEVTEYSDSTIDRTIKCLAIANFIDIKETLGGKHGSPLKIYAGI